MRKRCNVTITVDAEAYRRARIWAAERETSVSAVVSFLIARLPGSPLGDYAAEIVPHRHPATGPSASQRPNGVDNLIRAIESLSGRLAPPPKIAPLCNCVIRRSPAVSVTCIPSTAQDHRKATRSDPVRAIIRLTSPVKSR